MQHAHRHTYLFCLAAATLCLSGCTSFSDYVHHGFKVGPEYAGARAAVAPGWIDATDLRVRSDAADLSRWWRVFNDPVLNELVVQAYSQNINLKEYGTRILQARYTLAIQKGELFPQTQNASGSYKRSGFAEDANVPGLPKWSDGWNFGFNLAWELDFWGLYRRQVLNAQANMEASVENYDAVLVTLLGDVSQYYVTMREIQERIELTKKNVELQRYVLKLVQAKLKAGTVTGLDVAQQESTLAQTEASIPAFEIQLRQTQDQLCTLLGIPPADLQGRLGQRPIPTVQKEVVVGVPAKLLERVPSVRSAERAAAAQSQQIGIAQANLYPHISITGTLGYSAVNASQLFTYPALNGSVGPTFTWNILNYGRLSNAVRLQDALFQQTLLDYRTAVLTANQQAEDGLIAFLKSQEQTDLLDKSVIAADKAVQISIAQLRAGTVNFNQIATIEQTLVQQQDLEAQARANIALGLVQLYRALGGGWEIRLGPQGTATPAPAPAVPGPEMPEPPMAPQPPPRA